MRDEHIRDILQSFCDIADSINYVGEGLSDIEKQLKTFNEIYFKVALSDGFEISEKRKAWERLHKEMDKLKGDLS